MRRRFRKTRDGRDVERSVERGHCSSKAHRWSLAKTIRRNWRKAQEA